MNLDLLARIREAFERVDPRLLAWAERAVKRVPGVAEKVDAETDAMLASLDASLKPYRAELPTFSTLPKEGRPREEILSEMRALHEREQKKWASGFVSGAVYHGDASHVAFLNEVYALNAQSNPLHVDVWPSATKYEAEVVSMTTHLLGAQAAMEMSSAAPCGTMTSGGTESILLAMRTYRDWGRAERGIRRADVVVPESAHAAFDKAAQYLGMRLLKVPVGKDFRADVRKMRAAITRNTVALAGSAPCFPHGVIDPIEALSQLALERGIGFHTDACLGGFVLPWARKLGVAVPSFDFSLRGVTSISCDTHKYGFAAKGTSVILYRTPELRHFQFFTATEWPGGLYLSPSLAGSRPGALLASAWAAMVSMGESGYLEAVRRILETAKKVRAGIEALPELHVLGDPLFVIAFGSKTLDVYRLMDAMHARGWSLNGLHKPPALHICVTLVHTQGDVAERFLADLKASVAEVRSTPPSSGGMAPAYGMASSLPFRGVVADLLKKYLDRVYRV
ncbi:MAG: pyridoxal phosphate-dependent decarboxylase family protein [Myxococcaceae bacterium]